MVHLTSAALTSTEHCAMKFPHRSPKGQKGECSHAARRRRWNRLDGNGRQDGTRSGILRGNGNAGIRRPGRPWNGPWGGGGASRDACSPIPRRGPPNRRQRLRSLTKPGLWQGRGSLGGPAFRPEQKPESKFPLDTGYVRSALLKQSGFAADAVRALCVRLRPSDAFSGGIMDDICGDCCRQATSRKSPQGLPEVLRNGSRSFGGGLDDSRSLPA